MASPPKDSLARLMAEPNPPVRRAPAGGGSGSGASATGPGHDQPGAPGERPFDAPDVLVRGDGERILLVEDEDTVRTVTRRLLEKLGYEVDTAANAEEALDRFGEGDPAFDLVLTDIVMPGLTGVEMAEILMRDRPGLRFLFTSGYTSKELGRDPEQPPEPFLPKPFSIEELGRSVRQALESPPAP